MHRPLSTKRTTTTSCSSSFPLSTIPVNASALNAVLILTTLVSYMFKKRNVTQDRTWIRKCGLWTEQRADLKYFLRKVAQERTWARNWNNGGNRHGNICQTDQPLSPSPLSADLKCPPYIADIADRTCTIHDLIQKAEMWPCIEKSISTYWDMNVIVAVNPVCFSDYVQRFETTTKPTYMYGYSLV